MKYALPVIFVFILLFFSWDGVQAEPYFSLGERLLRQGDEGVDVAILQRSLAQLGLYDENKIDGIFGPATDRGVRALQEKKGLEVDGLVGPKTLAQLPEEKPALTSRSDLDREDIILLARVIHGEARGESFRGQVGVGAVILNRVESDKFPGTIREVILEDGQFSCIFDGQINYYPSETTLEAARAALLGYDPTRGALFFYNPSIATNLAWISGRTVAIRIGNHVFAY